MLPSVGSSKITEEKGEKEDVKEFNKVGNIMLYNIIISFNDKELMYTLLLYRALRRVTLIIPTSALI
jgi:hypothetical protein